jgi:pimeloyl-ACP methyl ester carboxylesterase
MSAKFAQYVALSSPERVIALILIAGCPTGQIELPAELIADWLDREGDAARMTDVPQPFMTRRPGAHLLQRFGEDAARVRRPALQGTLDAVMLSSFADRVASLTVPTLVIGGRGDPMFTPDTLRDAVGAPLTTARVALLDSGHEIPIEAPEELAALIEAFLAGLG